MSSASSGQTVAMAETDTAPALDDETTAALTLFNEYVDADRERTRREKRVKKAERAKDEAAARVKKLGERGSAEEKAAAEAAYREASEAWKRIRDGEEPEETEAKAAPAEEAAAAEDAPAEEAPAAEDAPAEEASTEAPAEEASTEEPTPATDRTDDDAEDAAGDGPVAEAPATDEAE